MTRYSLLMMLIYSVSACVGCATKNYVRNQVTPVIDKVNRLDDETAKNTNEIKNVNTRIAQALETLNTKSEEAASNANGAQQRSTGAQQNADAAMQRATEVSRTVANLENYQVVKQVSVHFGSGGARLDEEAARTLDELGSQCASTKNYILAVEGGADSTGDQDSNYSLSERRAEAVVNYLAARYGVPAFKMHMVGLGADKPVDSNNTASGRAENRRADVQLLSVEATTSVAPTGGGGPNTDDEESEARR
jgi:outer membrane protein OmpA-like peptidoglycan-associated protein